MSAAILLPALVAAIAGLVSTAAHRRLTPRLAVTVMVVTMLAVVIAVAPAVVGLAAGFVTHLPWFAGALSWCHEAFGLHAQVPQWLGVPATALVVWSSVRLWRVCRSWRRTRCDGPHGVEVLPSDELFAYAMPGSGGRIVVSRGLIERLDDVQFAIVLAHERAHAVHRHDRFLALGATCVALVPVLAPLNRRLRFALERWADEEAVSSLAVDRSVVARTLAAVALSAAGVPTGAAGVAGTGVGGRVMALLEPPSTGSTRASLLLGAAGNVAAFGAAIVQVHHVAPLFAALCHG